jgi:hypothetical protein
VQAVAGSGSVGEVLSRGCLVEKEWSPSLNTATTAKVPAPRQSDTTGDRGDTIGDGATSLQSSSM